MKINRKNWDETAAEMLHLYVWDNRWSDMFGDGFPALEYSLGRCCSMLVEYIFQQVYHEDISFEYLGDDYEATRSLCYELMYDYSRAFEPLGCELKSPLDSYENACQVCEKLYNELYKCVKEMQGEHLANLSESDAELVMNYKEKK